MEKLERAHEEGYIHLKYQDEAGISTEGVLGYSWMKKGEQKRVISVCKSRKRLSVLGVIERGTSFSYSLVSGGINSEQYLQFMEQEVRVAHEEFLKTGRLTVVVQDNWSVHKSKEVKKRLWEWWKKGLLVFYQPPYSPQMNRIEGEWLHLKYGELRGRCFANEEEVEAAFDAAVEHRYKQKSYKVRKVTIN